MRVLYLTPYVPSTIRLRSFNFVRLLAEQGHKVTLITLVGQREEPQALAKLRAWCHELVVVPTSKRRAAFQVLRSLPSSTPFQAAYGASQQLVGEARRRADYHDIVHIQHLRGSTYGPPLRDFPRLLDADDCISLLFERAFRQSPSLTARIRALLDLARTRRAEGRFGDTFPQVTVTSAEDRWALQQLQAPEARAPRIDVITMGVNLTAFTPLESERRKPATLVLSGKMSYHANEAAALYLGHEILPLIWRERPDVRCIIVGRDPTPMVRALASDSRITVTGAVEEIAPFLQQATIAVVPLRYGVGIQNKVLEAMATATPVVATPQAARAIHAQHNEEIMLAATAKTFANAVLELLESADHRHMIGLAGRQYVEKHHAWPHVIADLVTIYKRVASQK